MPVKILLASKSMEMGGIERSVVSLARELQARGHQTWVVSSGGHLVQELEKNGTPHVCAPLVVTSPAAIVRSALTIRRLLAEQEIDLIHSFSATASVAVNLALRLSPRNSRRVHLVSSPMGLQNSPREWPSTTWLRNFVMRLGAQRILVISPEIRRHLKRAFAPDAALIDFAFVGLDLDAFVASPDDRASVRREFGFGEDTLLVSTIGALHPRKSHDLFVDAAALVLDRVPEARFLVIGGGELREELEQHAARKNLTGKMAFPGVRDDIPRLLSATDVYVKPGVVEGYIGITVLEALALGKPVVAFDTQDVKLAVHDGVTGKVVPNGDVQAMAEQVAYLLQHPEIGTQLGRAGFDLVQQRFHFRQLAKQMEEFYQHVLTIPETAFA